MLKKLVIFAGLTSLMGFARLFIGAAIVYVFWPSSGITSGPATAPAAAPKIIHLTEETARPDCERLAKSGNPETTEGITVYRANSGSDSASLLLNPECLAD